MASNTAAHMTKERIKAIKDTIEAVLGGKHIYEERPNPIDEDLGPELIVDGIVSIWPAVIKLGSPKTLKSGGSAYRWPGFIVDTYGADSEPFDDEQYDQFMPAVLDLVGRLARAQVVDHFKRKDDDDYAKDMALAEVLWAKHAGLSGPAKGG